MKIGFVLAFGRFQCRRGHHAPLVWEELGRRPFPITNQPTEMLAASGFIGGIAKWTGWCPRCGAPVEWSSHKPPHLHGRRAA